jgi:hypothetical protein
LAPPQSASAVPGWQVFVSSQQPSGQAHGWTHAPAMHAWPKAQRWHTRPLIPQALDELPSWQAMFWSMQPVAHFPPSQTRAVALQVPLHGEQSTQILLPPPQFVSAVPTWHCEPESQQPFGQSQAHWQVPFRQSWSVRQRTHCFPPVPHAMALSPSWQAPARS